MSAYNNPKKYNKCIYKVSEVVKQQLLFQDNGDIQHTWQGPWSATAAAYYFKNSYVYIYSFSRCFYRKQLTIEGYNFHYSCVVLQWLCTR